MKYLKRWILLETININHIKDLCDASFANLYDEGFEIFGLDGKRMFENQTLIKLIKVERGNSIDSFTWHQIKDYYIPFLQLIKNKYDFISFTTRQFSKNNDNVRIEYVDWKYYSYEDLINGVEINENNKIYSISIYITMKKED